MSGRLNAAQLLLENTDGEVYRLEGMLRRKSASFTRADREWWTGQLEVQKEIQRTAIRLVKKYGGVNELPAEPGEYEVPGAETEVPVNRRSVPVSEVLAHPDMSLSARDYLDD